MVAVGLGLVRRLGLQVKTGPREAQRQGIGEIMARVAQERQRVRLEPGNQFHQNERSGSRQRPPENTAGRMCVSVTVSVGVHPLFSVYTALSAAQNGHGLVRSEEHTSELQSLRH